MPALTTTSPGATTKEDATKQSAISTILLITLALLSAAAPLATDLYLPAFPQMTVDLATSTTGVQLSLTTFLIGAGIGQVIFGPLSDRIGRRKPLIVGSILYVVVGVGAAMAPTIGILVALRLLQGLFGSAGMVIGRAVISDRAHGAEAARAFSLMMLVGGIAPIVGPVLGSILADVIGWRGLLWVVVGVGAIAAVAVLFVVSESHAAEDIAQESGVGANGGLRDLVSRAYIGNALAYGFSFATMMAYISASPFLYQEMMGLSSLQYGLAGAVSPLVGLGGELSALPLAAVMVTCSLVASVGYSVTGFRWRSPQLTRLAREESSQQ